MILRICVVIPVFDNPRTISRVTREVVTQVPFPILLIDDGSETSVTNVLYSFEVKEAIERGRVRVVRFDRTLGKGAALRYALRDLAAAGFTHMLTLDGDGRLAGPELKKLVALGLAHPWDLIVGKRKLATPATEIWWRRLVKRVLEACITIDTGARIEDPQSGVRLYPLLPLQRLRFRTTRYDFDLEILIRALWNGVRVREVEVDVVEPDPADVVQHFRRWGDTLRISILNLLLLGVTLLKTNSRPHALGFAIGVGVFIGCTPLIGLHAGVAVALALLLRLNVIAVLLGSRISTPLLLPALAYASLYIGQYWLKIPLTSGRWSHFYRLAAGSAILGVILGVIFGLLTYWFARSAQKSRPVDQVARGGQNLLARVVDRGGARAANIFAAVAATYYVIVSQPIRRGLGQFYRILEPRLTARERVVKRWRHVRRFIELRADQYLDPASTFAGDGVTKRPAPNATLITAHVGDWVNGARATGLGDRPVIYPDRPTAGARLEIIPFLGALAAFDVRPFAAALVDGRPVSTVFAVKTPEGAYVVHARSSREHGTRASRDEPTDLQVYEWAQRFVVQLEFMVKRYPDQWGHLYQFWTTIPADARAATHPNVLIEDLPSLPRLRPQRP